MQILVNLVSNALKFTTNGLVRIVARAEREGEDFILTFAVSDTGSA